MKPSQEIAMHNDKLCTYLIPIRPELNALLKLPRDLTRKEAERLKAVIDTLPFGAENETCK